MAVCTKCHTSLSLLENMAHMGKVKYCATCEQFIDTTIQRIQHYIFQASSQHMVTEQFCMQVQQDLATNGIPPERGMPLLQQAHYHKQVSSIRQGHLPTIRISAILDTDEQAHFETAATYYKPNKQVKLIPGSLIASNKKLYFISDDRDSMKVDWNNVVNVSESFTSSPNGQKIGLVHIQVSKGSGGGYYHVPDPTLATAIIDMAVRIWKRHLVELKENPNTQGIPEHVKATVFNRDHGTCRQCGYTGPYIEYDHIHPRSKGGPNTVENIQLLCRQCNLRKGNRV